MGCLGLCERVRPLEGNKGDAQVKSKDSRQSHIPWWFPPLTLAPPPLMSKSQLPVSIRFGFPNYSSCIRAVICQYLTSP